MCDSCSCAECNSPKAEATLYYLYIMSDGEVSESEIGLFDQICQGLDLSEEDKSEVIARCQVLAPELTDAYEAIIAEHLEDQLAKGNNLVRIIWNLVNLGFADTDYSESERRIVSRLLKRWQVPETVYQQMLDISEIILAIVKYKEWMEISLPEGEEKTNKLMSLDADIAKIFSDIKNLIQNTVI